jgi:hypothetical protein
MRVSNLSPMAPPGDLYLEFTVRDIVVPPLHPILLKMLIGGAIVVLGYACVYIMRLP